MSTGVAASCRTNATAGQCQTRRRSPMIIRCETTRKNTAGPYERGVLRPAAIRRRVHQLRPSRRPSPRGPKLLRRNRAPASSGTGLFGHWAFRALTFRGPPAGAGARKPPGKFGAAGGAQGGATGQSKGLQYSIFVYGRNGFAHLAVAFATLCLISGVTLVPVSNPTASTHTSARATSGVGSLPSAPRAVRRRPPRATRGRAR